MVGRTLDWKRPLRDFGRRFGLPGNPENRYHSIQFGFIR